MTDSAALERRQGSSLLRSLVGPNAQAVAFYVALIVGWELLSRAGIVREFVLPAPTTIVEAIGDVRAALISNAVVTIREIVIGFVLGSGGGFLLGVGIFYSSFLRRIIYPGTLFMQTVPKIALAPLFIVWFGIGEAPIIAITALICLFPVLINTVVGFESVDEKLLEMMHSVSANGLQKFRMIYLPSALPSVMAGLEVSSTLAVVGALVGEFIGAQAGLGYQIMVANSRLRTDELFAALIAVAAIGIFFFFGVKGIEHLLLRNRPSSRKSENVDPLSGSA